LLLIQRVAPCVGQAVGHMVARRLSCSVLGRPIRSDRDTSQPRST